MEWGWNKQKMITLSGREKLYVYEEMLCIIYGPVLYHCSVCGAGGC